MPAAALLGSVLLLLAGPGAAAAQVSVGGFVGAWDLIEEDRGASVHLALGGRLGVAVAGPVSVEAEALHVPTKRPERTADLFAYRMNVRVHLQRGGIEPFLLAGAGWQQWRTWRPSSSPGPKFSYDKGPGYAVGGGAIFRAREPMRFRIDLRHEHSDFATAAPSGFLGTLSIEVEL